MARFPPPDDGRNCAIRDGGSDLNAGSPSWEKCFCLSFFDFGAIARASVIFGGALLIQHATCATA